MDPQNRERCQRSIRLAIMALGLSLSILTIAHAQGPTFIRTFGTSGTGNGQFNRPLGCAVAPNGNIYVADSGNNRIEVFSPFGIYLDAWLGMGSSDSQLINPRGVAVDASGRVYVVDDRHRVEVFSASGMFITGWGSRGSGNGQFEYPLGVALDTNGDVYVADTYNQRIQRFHGDGTYVTQWGSTGTGPGQFTYPEGVAVDGSGGVYVSGQGDGRIQAFTRDGVFVGSWGGGGRGDGQLYGPVGIAADQFGAVYVADVQNHRIEAFTADGAFLLVWGGIGSANGQFDYPNGVAVDNLGSVYVADTQNNRIQVFSGVGLPSSITLDVAPNPSTFGDTLTLTAAVDPETATGVVRFIDSTTVLGTVNLVSGHATLTISALTAGRHPLTAMYTGSSAYRGSTSSAVIQTNARAGTSTLLTSEPMVTSWVGGLPLTLRMAVTRTHASAAPPTGTIQLQMDGTILDGALALDSAGHASLTTTFPLGAHAFTATYGGDGNYAPSVSQTRALAVTPPNPVIVGVHDVPNDQGGHVILKWRVPLDQPGMAVVTGYRVWRRAPAGLAPRPAPVASGRDTLPTYRSSAGIGDAYWEAIALLPAEQLGNYAYTAATTQDSIAGSNPYTAFFVTALSADPLVFYQSAVDSGYSVDNLAPPAPMPFVAEYVTTGTALHWSPSRGPDVALYRLHRGTSAGFTPGPENLVVAQADTGYFDPGGSRQFFYKLAALDVHGNVGRYAIATPGGPTATLATFLAAEVSEGSVRLLWYLSSDEPATLTVYRRDPQEDWGPLGTVTPDGTGYVRFLDDGLPSGARYGYRLGIREPGGTEVFAGESWVDLPLAAADIPLRVPNPVTGGDVTVSFGVPTGRVVPVTLFDAAGRVVSVRQVVGGIGRQSIALARASDLAPGLYLVRVGRDHPTVARVAVLH